MGSQRVRHNWVTELHWRLSKIILVYKTFITVAGTFHDAIIIILKMTLLFIYFLLYNIVLVLPYINMHPPQVYTCSLSWTPLPPPSPYHPSGSSQCTSPKLPVSCIEPAQAIHFLYDIIYVLMPFSQIIPPLPQSPKDCSILLCLFCCLADFLLLFCHLL